MFSLRDDVSPRAFWLLLAMCTVVYVIGLQLPLMDIDAAQYASIAREMLEGGSWLVVKHRGLDYLDKPPLVFWLAAFSMRVFGVHDWAYRLPSFCFTVLGLYSVYRLGTMQYNRIVGKLAVLMLYTLLAFCLFNHDIRTDTLLTGAVAFAVWQLYAYANLLTTEATTAHHTWRRYAYLFGGAVGMALAMLAKGPIGAVVPMLALASYATAYAAEWRRLFTLRMLRDGVLLVLTIAVCLYPMLWGLNAQFGSRGIIFYFWTQSFGRITGASEWHNNAGYLFFVHTFLWAALPWTLVAVFALWREGKAAFDTLRQRTDAAGYYAPNRLLLGGFVLSFVALSLSHYKLPHYIFVLMPFAALLAAAHLHRLAFDNRDYRRFKIFFRLQALLNILLWAAVIVLADWAFLPVPFFALLVFAGIFIDFVLYSVRTANHLERFVVPTILTALALNFMLVAHFYPVLLGYQSGSSVAAKINMLHRERPMRTDEAIYTYRYSSHALDFYAPRRSEELTLDSLEAWNTAGKFFWVVTDRTGAARIDSMGIHAVETYTFDDYAVTRLTAKFLDPARRTSQLGSVYLLGF